MEKYDKEALMFAPGREYDEEPVEIPDEVLAEMAEQVEEGIRDTYVYITKSGQTYHKSEDCPTLKHREYTKIKLSEVGDRKPCKRCCK